MKKTVALILVLVLTVLLCSCAGSGISLETTAKDNYPTMPSTTAPTDTEKDMRFAYYTALNTLYNEKKYPDGSECVYEKAFGEMSDNTFALCDVDADGIDELIICYNTCPLINMAETIFGYDPETGMLKQEFSAYPALTYYTNGLIIAESAHGHDNFNPYGIEQYDRETDTYKETATVDIWTKGAKYNDWPATDYPLDIDTANDGYVFIVTENNTQTIRSKAEMNAIQLSLTKGAQKITIPYMPMTQENIDMLNK